MSPISYHPLAKLLHWAVAGLIVLQFVLAKLADRAGDVSELRQLALLANHRSVGMTILTLAVLRLGLRLNQTPPDPLPMPAWQQTASEISHWLLYALLFLLPISGWLMSSASANSVSWFNLIRIPDLVAPDPRLKQVLEEVHETFARLLLVLAGIHVLAAAKHALIARDAAMRRISSTAGIAAFAAIIVLGVYGLARVSVQSTAVTNPGRTATSPKTQLRHSDLPVWNIDHSSSYIRFTGEQAGTEFSGEWLLWNAEIHFDRDILDAGSIDVNVLVSSVDTQDDDRDRTLQDPEWFDSAGFPQAFYQADEFLPGDESGYVANGRIIVRGLSTPAPLKFDVTENDGRLLLDGVARLDRLAIGIGTGEWSDPASVGRSVSVQVHVEATVTH